MELTLKFPDAIYTADPDYPRFFEALQFMLNRMAMSHYKYGTLKEAQERGADGIQTARQRMTMYDGGNAMDSCDCDPDVVNGLIEHKSNCLLRLKSMDTGNTENLLDAANCLIIEYLYPHHPKAHFQAQTAKESPGLVYKERT